MTGTPHPTLTEHLARARHGESHPSWSRVTLVTDTWMALVQTLAGAPWVLLGEWADGDRVMAAFLDEADGADGTVTVVDLHTQNGRFPTLSRSRPGAIRLERAIAELSGLTAEGLDDTRRWLDHDTWPVTQPLGAATPHQPGALPLPYSFRSAEGASLHQIPVGPVHAGIIEPGHFRFTCFGEAVVRLEDRLGYVHRGLESLMTGADLDRAARLAGRASGDSTVAYALAFARAVEAATRTQVPARAHWLRAVMAELERIANHLGDIGAVCNDVAFSLMHTHCGMLRERVLRAAAQCFGHRLMMDRVVPGGTTHDLDAAGIVVLRDLVANLRPRFEHLTRLYDETPSLQSRMLGTGTVRPELVRAWGCGGFVGRSAGRSFDARRSPGYEPYDTIGLSVPVLAEGDVNARVLLRIQEVRESLGLIEKLVADLPAGPIRVPVATDPDQDGRNGTALVESFRGDVLAWVRLNGDGTIGRCHLRDPSWFQWPVLTAAIENNIVADFPVCNKSFNCSYAGHDL